MPLNLVKPFRAPNHDIECVVWEPAITEKERARLMLLIEIRRLNLNGRSVRLRPLVGETDPQPE